MSSSSTDKNNSGVLRPLSNGFYVAITYGMLFVALMLVTGKKITVDGLAIPVLILFLAVKLTEYITAKNNKARMPQWAVVGFFIISVATAIVITILN